MAKYVVGKWPGNFLETVMGFSLFLETDDFSLLRKIRLL